MSIIAMHHGLMAGIKKGGFDPGETVTIGTQTWMKYNLDLKVDGITIGASGVPTTPAAWYYNNDEATYGKDGKKYGLLYNGYAVKYIEDNKATLCPGWHVPTTSEWYALATEVGGASTASKKLKSTTGWSIGAGIDVYGFSVFPAGRRGGSGNFADLTTGGYFWTATEISSSTATLIHFGGGASMESINNGKESAFSVRLVKDT